MYDLMQVSKQAGDRKKKEKHGFPNKLWAATMRLSNPTNNNQRPQKRVVILNALRLAAFCQHVGKNFIQLCLGFNLPSRKNSYRVGGLRSCVATGPATHMQCSTFKVQDVCRNLQFVRVLMLLIVFCEGGPV